MSQLRDYQEAGLNMISAAAADCLAQGIVPSVLAVAPTGAGKSVMIREMIARGARKAEEKKRQFIAWVIVPKLPLIGQMHKHLLKVDVKHGIIQGASELTDYSMPVQLCSMDSLRNRLKKYKFRMPNLVIWDEAHHVAEGNTYGSTVEFINEQSLLQYGAYPVHSGLTATPVRADGKGMGANFNRMVIVATISELIQRRFLKPPRYMVGAEVDLSCLKAPRGKDWTTEQAAALVDNPKVTGNSIEQYKREGVYGRPALTFAASIAHSQHVVEQFKAAGIPAAHIDQSTPTEERERLVKALEAREILNLSSVGVFTEGFDCPAVSVLFILRKTASLSLNDQMIGRGLRVEGQFQDGDHCIVFDHVRNVDMHGPVTEDRGWTLEAGATKRRADKEGEPKEGRFECPACAKHFDTWTPACPFCGADVSELAPKVVVPEFTDVEMVEYAPKSPEERAAELRARQLFYREIEETAYSMGYETKWVGIRFSKKFGGFPTREDRALSNGRIAWRKDGAGKWEAVWRDAAERERARVEKGGPKHRPKEAAAVSGNDLFSEGIA